jgi:hypothetical protein
MSNRLGGLFKNPTSLYPVAFRKALQDNLLTPVPLAMTSYPKPDPVGAMPKFDKRTGKQESEFKHIHKKDVLGAGRQEEAPTSPEKDTKTPWLPVGHGDECPDGCHIGYKKTTDRYSSIFQERNRFITDGDLDADEDIRKLVEYASKLDANETLATPKPETSEPEKESGKSEWTFTEKNTSEIKTNAVPGSTPVKKDKSFERGRTYKPEAFNKKFAVKEQKDEEGLHQYELNALYGKTETEFTIGRVKNEDLEGYKLGGKAGVKGGFLDWKNTWKIDQQSTIPAEAGVQVTAVEAGAEVQGGATVDYKKGEAATKGKLAANMTLISGKVGAKQCFVPARPIDAACKSDYLNWAFPDKLCKAIETGDYDWGVCLGAEGGVSVGLGGEVGGEAKIGKSGAKAKISGGLQIGPGVKGATEIEVKKFERN